MINNRFLKYIVLILISLCILSSYMEFNESYYNEERLNVELSNDLALLETQSFTKDDYEQKIDEEEHGLGSIAVTNIAFNESGFLNHTDRYPEFNEDLVSKALNVSYKKTEFSRTIKEARADLFEELSDDYNIITIELNETLEVHYNTSIDYLEGYIVYYPRLFPCLLNHLYVHNDSSQIKEVNPGNYSVDDKNSVIFNYADYFNGAEKGDFQLYFFWEYNLTIQDWDLNQVSEDDLFVRSATQNITGTFNYIFNVLGEKLEGDSLTGEYPFTDLQVGAVGLTVSLRINHPDKKLIEEFVFNEEGYAGKNNNIFVTFSANDSLFDMNFETTFTVDFLKPVNYTWTIDRLAQPVNNRERIYFPSVIYGPEQIFLKFAKIEERTISIDQVVDTNSLFNREINYIGRNFTEFQEEVEDSLVFTEKVIQKRGLEITLPYLLLNETCPFIIKYQPSEDLRVIITDNIRMPLRNIEVEIQYYGKTYGSYISKEQVQPTSKTITDNNGEIFIKNVPSGDYTLLVFQQGKQIEKATVLAYKQINYVITDITHYPVVILSFLIPSSVLIILGVLVYLFYKKKE